MYLFKCSVYEEHMQTLNLTIYYDNMDLYVYYIINIYIKSYKLMKDEP